MLLVNSIKSPFWEFIGDAFVHWELLAFILFFCIFLLFKTIFSHLRATTTKMHSSYYLEVQSSQRWNAVECRTALFSLSIISYIPTYNAWHGVGTHETLPWYSQGWLPVGGCRRIEKNDNHSCIQSTHSHWKACFRPGPLWGWGYVDASPHRQCAAYTDSGRCVPSCALFSPSKPVSISV